MEVSTGESCRIELNCLTSEGSEEFHEQDSVVESPDSGVRLHAMNALEILRETVRILRYNSSVFMAIGVCLICPVSALLLSNVLVDQSIVKRLTNRLLILARSSGMPLKPHIKQSCQRLSEMALASIFCFPMYITFSLLSKAAVVYSVDCTYSRKNFNVTKFFKMILKIWKRLVATYIWDCMAIVGCLALFLVLLVAVCNICTIAGCSSDMIVYPAMIIGLVFSIVFANTIIICNLSIVISVLEDISGPEALLRASIVMQGQTQVGLLIFLGSTIGTTIVEGLFEHRVKVLSYGDGSSRMWEGPLLVVMHSFVVLIDSMMSAVFYFTCRSSSMDSSERKQSPHRAVEIMPVSSESIDIQ